MTGIEAPAAVIRSRAALAAGAAAALLLGWLSGGGFASENPAGAAGEAASSPSALHRYDIADLLIAIPEDDDEGERGGDAWPTRRELAEEVILLIQETVDPEAWGRSDTVEFRDNQLIVNAPAPIHRDLRLLLGQLRETRVVDFWVEATFVQVSDEGIKGLGESLRRKVDRARELEPQAPEAAKGPADAVVLEPGEVRSLLKAVEDGFVSHAMAVPPSHVVVGQRATFASGVDREYVSDVIAKRQPGGRFGYEPVYSLAWDGATLETTVVSLDRSRRFATVDVLAGTSEVRLREVTWAGPGDGPPYAVEKPVGTVSELRARFRVPEAAWALVGGFRQTRLGTVPPGDPERRRDLLLLISPHMVISGSEQTRRAWKGQVR